MRGEYGRRPPEFPRDLIESSGISSQSSLLARISLYATLLIVKLPGGEQAVVDPEKLVGYCLNLEHPRGKHKARVFGSVLGFSAQNADELRAALLAAAAAREAVPAASDRFGERYLIDFEISGPRGTGTVRSAWIVRRGERVPRLTSCYVK